MTRGLALTAGSRLGPYEIVSPLGAGGMGEVYRARDSRLGREVALKVLPESLAQDADRLRRFEQEARAASSLNHPNIVTIHEVGSANGISYIAMELVDGVSLAHGLATGPLPERKMLDVAVQIADGLAKAHSAGIVHRDLKPENVMVSRDGYVKLLDFGLAKLFVAPGGDESTAPTAAPQRTLPGSVLGTVGYMSPEQASGRPVDYRSDQFSFGSILYEMTTGHRAFQRPTGVETLVAIIQDEPEPVAQVSPKTPPPLRWIVERCLAKDPHERYASTLDLVRDLKSIRDHISEVTGPSSGTGITPVRRRRSRFLPVAAVLVILAGVLVGLVGRFGTTSQPSFQRLTFQRGTVSAARFGPDGGTVYYAASWEGSPSRIFSLRPGTPESSALSLPPASLVAISSAGEMAILIDPSYATENGFALRGILARVPLSGGVPKELLANVTYADWAPKGDLLVVRRVGGKDRLEYPIDRVLYETAGWIQDPRFSPDGRRIAFLDHSTFGDDGAVSLVDTSGKKTELAGGWATVQGLSWSPDGSEVWFTAAREGVERELFGVTPSGRLRQVRALQGSPALFDVRADRTVLMSEDDYRSSILAFSDGQPSARDLTWFDWANDRALSADGKVVLFDETGEGGGAGGAVYLRPIDGSPAVRLADGIAISLSPDSKWALTRTIVEPSHFVMVPVRVGEPHVFPPDGLGRAGYGAFFPDGLHFVFSGSSSGRGARLFTQAVSGGAPHPISDEGITPSRVLVSPDGAWIATVGSDFRLWLFPAAGGPPRGISTSEPGDLPAGWSQDGRVLYVSRQGVPCSVDTIDLGSGARAHLRDLAETDAAGVTQLGPARVTPDGKTMLAGMNRVLSTLYRIRGLK